MPLVVFSRSPFPKFCSEPPHVGGYSLPAFASANEISALNIDQIRGRHQSRYKNALLASSIWQKSVQTFSSAFGLSAYSACCVFKNSSAAFRSAGFGGRPYASANAVSILFLVSVPL